MKQTERGPDRLTSFTDAIAAIVIALRVLPLVEPVADAAARRLLTRREARV